MTRILPQSRKPKQYQRLHDSDGTVYDPDTGLPVARAWDTAHSWRSSELVFTNDPMMIVPPGGSAKFVKVSDAADSQFTWDQVSLRGFPHDEFMHTQGDVVPSAGIKITESYSRNLEG